MGIGSSNVAWGAGLAAGVGGALVILVVVAIVLALVRRRQTKSTEPTAEFGEEVPAATTTTITTLMTTTTTAERYAVNETPTATAADATEAGVEEMHSEAAPARSDHLELNMSDAEDVDPRDAPDIVPSRPGTGTGPLSQHASMRLPTLAESRAYGKPRWRP